MYGEGAAAAGVVENCAEIAHTDGLRRAALNAFLAGCVLSMMYGQEESKEEKHLELEKRKQVSHEYRARVNGFFEGRSQTLEFVQNYNVKLLDMCGFAWYM